MTTAAPSPSAGGSIRVAWFSPMPPSRSGIAAYSDEILPRLRAFGVEVEVFVDAVADLPPDTIAARDFVWMARRRPFDLTIYQLGNAACHDYMWGYLFRYPGLVVLHDAQLHQARARALLTRWQPRVDDYLDEFAWNHPGAPRDIASLVAAGLGGALYAHWPHVRLVLQAARLTAVHSPGLAARLAEDHGVEVRAIPMGVADPLAAPGTLTPLDVRARHGIPADALVVGAFGGLTPEKRLPQLLTAVAALVAEHPTLHVLLVGAPASHYDVAADAVSAGLSDRVHVTGFVPDEALPAYVQAADICASLRWPTSGETSASWWRAMAAGRPTIVTDLAHQSEVPVLDPLTWRATGAATPVAVAVPILDEAAGIVAAIDGLARNHSLRVQLGAAARDYWRAGHTLDAMAAAYVRVLRLAAGRPAPRPDLPAHLRRTGAERLPALLTPFGLDAPAGIEP